MDVAGTMMELMLTRVLLLGAVVAGLIVLLFVLAMLWKKFIK